MADQARQIEGIALVRGERLEVLFVEKGTSGSIPLEDRPQGKNLLAALQSGDVLIVSKLDRAFRNASDALIKADLWKNFGVKVIVADMGIQPVTDSGVGKMFFGMLALIARVRA